MAGWLFRDAALEEGERLVFRRGANLRRGARRIGGEVSVTDRRLLFLPNVLEHLVRAPDVGVPLASVLEVTVVPPPRVPELLRNLPRAPRPTAEIETAEDTLQLELEDAEALAHLLRF